MKKLLLLIILFYVLGSCEIAPRQVVAYTTLFSTTDNYGHLSFEYRIVDGIEYHMYFMGSAGQSASVFVINHTKEVAETELIKLQLLSEKQKWKRN